MSQAVKNLHLIGKVHSSQGVRGAIFVILSDEEPAWVPRWKNIFLTDKDGAQKTFPILKKQGHTKQGKRGFMIQLEGVNDRDVAESLIHHDVWVPEDYLISKKGETIYLREILNFIVVDATRGEVGPVTGFSSNGAQDLLCVDRAGTIYDVPFVKAFIVKIDFENQKIHMDIPQGLLEEIE